MPLLKWKPASDITAYRRQHANNELFIADERENNTVNKKHRKTLVSSPPVYAGNGIWEDLKLLWGYYLTPPSGTVVQQLTANIQPNQLSLTLLNYFPDAGSAQTNLGFPGVLAVYMDNGRVIRSNWYSIYLNCSTAFLQTGSSNIWCDATQVIPSQRRTEVAGATITSVFDITNLCVGYGSPCPGGYRIVYPTGSNLWIVTDDNRDASNYRTTSSGATNADPNNNGGIFQPAYTGTTTDRPDSRSILAMRDILFTGSGNSWSVRPNVISGVDSIGGRTPYSIVLTYPTSPAGIYI